MENLKEAVIQAFEDRFQEPPALIIRAPGRVNLIGEHTDYNDGFVLPLAINRAVWLALRPRPDNRVVVYSLNFPEADPVDLGLDHIEHAPGTWGEYVRGVAWAFQEAGFDTPGWEGVLISDVPVGAGLSSSAALELAIARAFTGLSGQAWEAVEMARLGQKVENEWLGVNSGIMDQMISASGQADHAILIDCRDLTTTPVPLPGGTAILILDTATRRGLVDSAYNERRSSCEAAAAFFGASHLRDVTAEQLITHEDELDSTIRMRAHHVISENDRTLAAARAMNHDDAVELGRLMDASHASLRDDFEVSSDALDAMVEITRSQHGVFGARMTGAGFGGCAVALVDVRRAEEIARTVEKIYEQRTGLQPMIYLVRAVNGVSLETTDHKH